MGSGGGGRAASSGGQRFPVVTCCMQGSGHRGLAELSYMVALEHQRVLCTGLKNKRTEQLCALREEETSFLQPTGIGLKRHLNRVF